MERTPVARSIAGWVRAKIEAFLRTRAEKKGDDGRDSGAAVNVAGHATATAVGAIEGTLKGKSLEGALKEAQILREYAEARNANAAAALHEAEARKLRQDTAFDRLERSIALLEKLGAPVGIVVLSDGRPAITIGNGLVEELTAAEAELALPTASAEGSRIPETDGEKLPEDP